MPMSSRGPTRYADGTQLLMLATTLEKLILGTRPFWGGKTGPIRVTIFPYPVPCIPRWLLPIMYGGEDRKFPQGAVSFCSPGAGDDHAGHLRHRRRVLRAAGESPCGSKPARSSPIFAG